MIFLYYVLDEETGCGDPNCPGKPNCNGRGYCNPGYEPPICTDCHVGWTGPACDDPCIHGYQNGSLCVCNTTCHHGAGCNIECSSNGVCNDKFECFCDPLVGWSGTYCEVPGCPRHPENDIECSGHGDCNSEDRTCSCFAGWMGVACHIADCQGEPNCYDRGVCDEWNFDPPKCQNCSGNWMGLACNDPCVNGTETPMNSGNCECDPGYAGVGCDSECSGHGLVKNKECECDYVTGWKGDLCDIPGCAGLNKLDCSDRGNIFITCLV